jgi:hypothetical protein
MSNALVRPLQGKYSWDPFPMGNITENILPCTNSEVGDDGEEDEDEDEDDDDDDGAGEDDDDDDDDDDALYSWNPFPMGNLTEKILPCTNSEVGRRMMMMVMMMMMMMMMMVMVMVMVMVRMMMMMMMMMMIMMTTMMTLRR